MSKVINKFNLKQIESEISVLRFKIANYRILTFWPIAGTIFITGAFGTIAFASGIWSLIFLVILSPGIIIFRIIHKYTLNKKLKDLKAEQLRLMHQIEE
jgi:hypothetical protein